MTTVAAASATVISHWVGAAARSHRRTVSPAPGPRRSSPRRPPPARAAPGPAEPPPRRTSAAAISSRTRIPRHRGRSSPSGDGAQARHRHERDLSQREAEPQAHGGRRAELVPLPARRRCVRRAARKAARTAAAPSPTSPISITVAATPADRNMPTLVIMMISTERGERDRRMQPGSEQPPAGPLRRPGGDDPSGDPADQPGPGQGRTPTRQIRVRIISTPKPVTGGRPEEVNCQSGGSGRERSRLLAYTASSSVGPGRVPRRSGLELAARSQAPWASRKSDSGSRASSTPPRFAHPSA